MTTVFRTSVRPCNLTLAKNSMMAVTNVFVVFRVAFTCVDPGDDRFPRDRTNRMVMFRPINRV